MSPSESALRRRAVIATAVTAALSLAVDLATKSWAWNNLRDGDRVTVIKHWFYLDFSFNTGSAFGFLRGTAYARPLFITITLLTVVYMAALARKLPARRLYGFVAIGLIIGGALGNLHDRLFRQLDVGGTMTHGVVDFIQIFYSRNHFSWPNFNIADTTLVIGVVLLIPFLLLHAPDPEPAKPTA
ncbi:MAG: signal peptidase II [Myxococcales bacterium]|nr:signal peptidase II [Myxococcales bacterium]